MEKAQIANKTVLIARVVSMYFLVSLFGVMFLLKGTFLIALPELRLQAGQNSMQVMWPMAVGFIGVGLLVGYVSYFYRRLYSTEDL